MSQSYWWVVQGGNYADERDSGILWAPLATKDGHRKSHWTSMSRVAVGDVVIHYADVHVRAVSRVTHSAELAPRPFESEEWGEEGLLIRTAYEELLDPLHRDEIPLYLRRSQTQPNAPFFRQGGRIGHVNLGYLFDLTAEGGAAIVDVIEGAEPRAASSPGLRGNSNALIGGGSPSDAAVATPTRSAWTPPKHDDRVFHHQPPTDDLSGDVNRTVTYEEFKLQSEFGAWLAEQDTPAEILSLPSGRSWIQPDFHVPSRSWIVEAKKSDARPYVRLAIGQVLDYVAVAERHKIIANPVILLPRLPSADLVDLVARHGIWLAVPSANEGFGIIEP